jgi:glycosyltransferase involved in cell wall biosynthesis
MIDHYRERFPNCRIVVYDSGSTDATLKIAEKNACEIRTFSHYGQFDEDRHVAIKNHCWKDASTDWVLMCDLDELLDINTDELKTEEADDTTIVRSEAYDMVDMDDKLDIAGMKYGVRDYGQDKSYLFNKKYIREINYASGCHSCNPEGTIVHSNKTYKLYHYCYPNYEVSSARFKLYRARINPNDNKSNSYYSETPEQTRALYTEAREKAIKVR